MTDIIDFLRARYDEDEYRSRAVHNFACDSWPEFKPDRCNCGEPQRLRTEVEAKRTVLDVLARCANVRWTGTYAVVEEARRPLRALALPYVDHPDYDPTWRPVSNTV